MKRRLLHAAAWLSFASAPADVRADGGDLAEILEEPIITTASQTAETATSAPATSTSIDSDELRRYGIRTLAEALDFLALGLSSTGGRTASSGIDLGARGVALANDRSSHFLLLIDGHAVNEPFIGGVTADHGLGIPLEAVDRIEAVVGPGSVLYGSSAMLGVINIVTKSATRSYGAHAALELELPVGARALAYGATSFRLFGETATLSGAAQYWHQYGPAFEVGPQRLGLDPITRRPIRTTREGPETGIWGGVLERSNFARTPGGLVRLRVGSLEVSLRGLWETKGQPFSAHDFDDPEATYVTRNASVDVDYRRLLTSNLQIHLRAYADGWDILDRTYMSSALACAYPGVSTCRYDAVARSRWAGSETQLNFDALGDGRLTTLVGLDARIRSVGSKQDTLDADTGEHIRDSSGLIDITDATVGMYAQQIFWPAPRLMLNAGARLDHDPRFSPVLSPRGAVSYTAWRGATVRSIYSEAFRAPNFWQSDYGDPLTARAESLNPERVRSIEGSFEQRSGTHRLFFGVFRSWWRDMIELRFLDAAEARAAAERGLLPIAVPGVAHAQHRNAARIDSVGFNAGVDGRVGKRFWYGLSVTEAYSRRRAADGDPTPLPAAPHLTGNGRVAVELGEPYPALGLAGYVLAPRLIDRGAAAGFDPTPHAPARVHLSAAATGRIPVGTGWSYRLRAERVFGTRGPYAIGSLLVGTEENPAPEFSPSASYGLTLGVHYELPAD
jgi:outer membrane receptor for ferrienterochelin and colicins